MMKLGKIFICINLLIFSLLMLTGCGCLSKSSGELKIEQYNYQTQYIIPELSKFMPFDFAIFKNGKLVCLIEFYRPIDFLGGEDN